MRRVLSVLVGFVVTSVIMMAIESLNGQVLYPELGEAAKKVTDRETLRKLMASAPIGAMLVVIGAWVIGAFAGGATAAWIARKKPWVSAIILSILLTLAGVANNLMLPPPLWFWIVSVACLLPATLLGARCVTAPASVSAQAK